MNILLLEDDLEIQSWIENGLTSAGHKLDCFTSGRDALIAATTRDYDLLVLDRMVPELDGLSVLKTLRQTGQKTPVLLLTALGDIDDRVEGLEAGADDYLPKPFAFSELQARVMALGRRGPPNSEQTVDTILRCGDLELNLLTQKCKRAGQVIPLQGKEIRLLEVLLRNKGRVITRTMLLERVWNINFEPTTSVVETLVSRLRTKIDKPFTKQLLKTNRGIGYVLEE